MIKPPAWTSKYLKIPFRDRGLDRKGCDCYGLCRLILLEQAGCELPDYPGVKPGANIAKLRKIVAGQHSMDWLPVFPEAEQAFDIVLMRGQFEAEGHLHSRPIHMGCVVAPGMLIHAELGSGVTVVEYRTHPMIKSRIDSFWRLAAYAQRFSVSAA